MEELTYDVIQGYFDTKLVDKAEGTKMRHLSDLRHFDAWLRENRYDDPTAIGANELDNYFRQQKGEDYAPYTISSRFDAIRGMFEKLAGMMGEMEATPFEDLRRKDYVPKLEAKKDAESPDGLVYVEQDQLKQMVEHAPAPKFQNELLLKLIFHTGMRRGEVANLKREHVDTERREIEAYDEKTGKRRLVFYTKTLDTIINLWLEKRRPSIPIAESSPYFFITADGKVDGIEVNKRVKQAAENAGIQEVMYVDKKGDPRFKITTHALRHGHGVHAVKSGVDPKSIQKQMGHEDIEQTMEYVRFVSSDVKDAYRSEWEDEL